MCIVVIELFQVPAAADLSTACQLSIERLYWKSFLNCSLRYEHGKSASLVEALHFVIFRLFLHNCITPFSLNCKNVLYRYWYLLVVPCIFFIEYLDWLSRNYLMKHDCPTMKRISQHNGISNCNVILILRMRTFLTTYNSKFVNEKTVQ